jgi:Na+-transporting methylmalonyl-CoA/oxaloacetate decarboxylase gamma subunit
MPVLVIAIVFLLLFLIMGVMSVSAVISERRFDQEVHDYKIGTGISVVETPRAGVKRAGAVR